MSVQAVQRRAERTARLPKVRHRRQREAWTSGDGGSVARRNRLICSFHLFLNPDRSNTVFNPHGFVTQVLPEGLVVGGPRWVSQWATLAASHIRTDPEGSGGESHIMVTEDRGVKDRVSTLHQSELFLIPLDKLQQKPLLIWLSICWFFSF